MHLYNRRLPQFLSPSLVRSWLPICSMAWPFLQVFLTLFRYKLYGIYVSFWLFLGVSAAHRRGGGSVGREAEGQGNCQRISLLLAALTGQPRWLQQGSSQPGPNRVFHKPLIICNFCRLNWLSTLCVQCCNAQNYSLSFFSIPGQW